MCVYLLLPQPPFMSVSKATLLSGFVPCKHSSPVRHLTPIPSLYTRPRHASEAGGRYISMDRLPSWSPCSVSAPCRPRPSPIHPAHATNKHPYPASFVWLISATASPSSGLRMGVKKPRRRQKECRENPITQTHAAPCCRPPSGLARPSL